MIKLIKDMLKNGIIRYIVAGIATTLVNFIVYGILKYGFSLGMTSSNVIAIISAMLFAFVINKLFVFQMTNISFGTIFEELCKFISARLVTMAIEVFGMIFLVNFYNVNDFLSKLIIQIIVMVLNYVFSKLFVFNKKKYSDKNNFVTDNLIYFIIGGSLIIMIAMYWIVNDIAPFGDKSIVLVDGLHQYLPFFSEYYEKLKNGENLLYSWNIGMGTNFLALWAYYLASPINLLIVLFPKNKLYMGVGIIIEIKIILSALTFAYMLIHRVPSNKKKLVLTDERERKIIAYRKRDFRIIGFSLSYALSNFILGYFWNVMWLDSVILLPLIVLGLDYLIKKNDPRLYCITLFLSLFCNFYMTFMICIFLVMWFFTCQFNSVKNFILKGISFAIYSLLAAGMAAIVLIPTYWGLMQTSSGKTTSTGIPKYAKYTEYVDILQSHLAYTAPFTNDNFDGRANLYCGVIGIALVILYMFDKKVLLRQKILRIVILLFFVISFNVNVLNYIWHGFHDQYGIPNRMAFIYIFMILLMSYEVLCHIGSIKKILITLCFIAAIGGIFYIYLHVETKSRILSYIITIALLFLYYVVIMLYRNDIIGKRIFSILLGGFISIEAIAFGVWGFCQSGTYSANYYFEFTNPIESAKESVDDGTFYREELNKSRMLDEATLHNLRSVGLFGSTAYGNLVDTLSKLGFYTAANEYLYNGRTQFTDTIFGVKYLYARLDEDYISSFEYYNTVSGVEIYKNNYVLPIGFVVNEDILNSKVLYGNSFDVQNNFAKNATGMPNASAMYEKVLLDSTAEGQNCTTVYDTSGRYNFTKIGNGTCKVTMELDVDEDMNLYLYMAGSDLSSITVWIDGEKKASGRLFVQNTNLGYVTEGQKIKIEYSVKADGGSNGYVRVNCAKFNQEIFENVYEKLNKNSIDITEFTNNCIKGNVEVDNSGVMFTSIPFDEGWKIIVDGKEVEKLQVVNAFLGFKISSGTHNIKMIYVPVGYEEGKVISISSFAIFILILMLKKQRKARIIKVEKVE